MAMRWVSERGSHYPEPVSSMLDALDLKPSSATADMFVGSSQWQPQGRLFGGQVMAQAAMAAMATIDDDRSIHSLHGYFLKPGDVDLPVTLKVDRIYDGRSFSTRRTQALQEDLPIFSMIASFQRPDEGLDHFDEPGVDLGDPESLKPGADVLMETGHPFAEGWAKTRPVDFRYGHIPQNGEPHPHASGDQVVWFKTLATLPDDPQLHRAVLAYISDSTLLEPILARHDVSWTTPGLRVASLDHAMWFHRFARVDQWLAYVQHSPTAQNGRGLAQGKIYDRVGTLIATVAQEGMVRVPSRG
jgi:acyl-CoA thioesterase II